MTHPVKCRQVQNRSLKPSKDEIVRVIGEIERTYLKELTKREHKVTLKRFYRGMNGGEDTECTAWVHISTKSKTVPDELLTITKRNHPLARSISVTGVNDMSLSHSSSTFALA